MAVNMVLTKKEFVGMSDDTKPNLVLIDAGAKFYEIDTGQTFIWSGDNWFEDLTMVWALKTAFYRFDPVA